MQLHFAPAAATAKLAGFDLPGRERRRAHDAAAADAADAAAAAGRPGRPAGTRRQRTGRIPGNGIDQALHGGHVNAVADERTNSLIITAPAETLKLIDTMLKELDSNPEPASELKAIALKYADADATAKLLNSTFKPDDRRHAGLLHAATGHGGTDSQHVHVNVTSDARTNSLIVSAPAEAMKQIETLVQQLDANPAATSEMKVFSLKHANAFDAAELIKAVFPTEQGPANPLR